MTVVTLVFDVRDSAPLVVITLASVIAVVADIVVDVGALTLVE
jgi:hypothetical protein